jgi:hypothetical protein
MLPVAIGAQIVGDRTNNPLSPGTFQSLSLCAALFAHKNSSAADKMHRLCGKI